MRFCQKNLRMVAVFTRISVYILIFILAMVMSYYIAYSARNIACLGIAILYFNANLKFAKIGSKTIALDVVEYIKTYNRTNK